MFGDSKYDRKTPAIGRTNNSVKLFRRNGDVFAVPHKKQSEGITTAAPKLPSNTTYKEDFNSNSIMEVEGGTGKKPLTKYYPNAPRCRLPVKFPDEPKRGVRFCKPRNESQFDIRDPNMGHTDARRFLTVNKITYTMHSGLPTGFGNQGIQAEKTRWLHHMQKK